LGNGASITTNLTKPKDVYKYFPEGDRRVLFFNT